MRHFVLFAASVSVLALGACSSMKFWDSEDGNTPPKAAATAEAPPAITASETEKKEMAALMGDSKGEVDVAAKDVPPNPVMDMAAADTKTTAGAAPSGAPTDCPAVEVLPDTKSITYFDDPEGKPTGGLVARAALVDIKGGCDYTDNAVVVDIDMIMQGKITNKGRYEGRQDLEAFMTFPYFVAIMAPDGKMIDKKIMATAMRFKPNVDDLDHAEKITQKIPLDNIALGPQYTITLGFQLNRAQLDYNRGGTSESAGKMEGKKAKPEPAKAAPAPAEAKSGAAKMQPVTE